MSELLTQGLSDAQARRIALAEYGDVQASRRELAAVDRRLDRRRRIASSLDGIAQDVRIGLRSLRRRPTFGLASVGTLAIGIGDAEGAVQTNEKLPPLQLFTTVGGDYFQTMRIPLLRGRLFNAIPAARRRCSGTIRPDAR